MIQCTLGNEGFVPTCRFQPINVRSSKQEPTRSTNWTRSHGGMLLTSFFLLYLLSYFSNRTQTHLPRNGDSHGGLGSPTSITIQKILHRHAHRPIGWRWFFSWGFPGVAGWQTRLAFTLYLIPKGTQSDIVTDLCLFLLSRMCWVLWDVHGCLHLCTDVHHVYVWCPQGSEGIGSLRTRVTDVYEPPYGCWELNPFQSNWCFDPWNTSSAPSSRSDNICILNP